MIPCNGIHILPTHRDGERRALADPMATGKFGPMDSADPVSASVGVIGPVDRAQARPPNATTPRAAAPAAPLCSEIASMILL